MNTKAKPQGKWVKPPARHAGARKRHWALVFSFLLMVVAPLALAYHVLWNMTGDQYASEIGFSVRTEETASAIELLGGISSIAGGSGSDSDILYEYIQSQQMVRFLDEELDLERIFNDGIENPIFVLPDNPTIEDLTQHWRRKLNIYHDSGTGLIDIKIIAFSPDDAAKLANAVVEEASAKINALSDISRDDATRNSRQELTAAEDRLRKTRQALVEFRNRYQIVDPSLESQTQIGVLTSLQQQLSTTYVELDLLSSIARDNDPRIRQATRKIKVIEERIAEERSKISISGGESGKSFSGILAEYEGLSVDLEFAQQSYIAAQANLDSSLSRAQRQSRYLAVHIGPTISEASQYPKRSTNLIVVGTFLLLFWSFIILIYFAVRDRR